MTANKKMSLRSFYVFIFALLACLSDQCFSYLAKISTIQNRGVKHGITRQQERTVIRALTERQKQFWEDVDDGLDTMETKFSGRGLDIKRVRQFAKRARGEIPLPAGYAPGHMPSEEHIDGLSAKPFWDVHQEQTLFPWASALEENSHIVREEFESKLLKSGKFESDSVFQNEVMGKGWSAVRLQRLGVWNVEHCKQFPKTYTLLQSLNIPFAVRGVCFARQAPRSGVKPHTDGRNFILTSHLGLKIPSDCWVEVGGERRCWQEGKLTTIDSSFLHSTQNQSDEDRHVLIIDYWHPECNEAERSALEFVYDLRNKYESGIIPFRKPRAANVSSKLKGRWMTPSLLLGQ